MKTKEFHGKTNHPLYKVWVQMRERCRNPKNRAFHKYGGRGIAVCDRWDDSFAAFLEDMGERPAGHSIERIDNDGPYSPENCRWATPEEQAINTRFSSPITHDGMTMSLRGWARHSRIPYVTLLTRCRKMPFEVAITAPNHRGRRTDLRGPLASAQACPEPAPDRTHCSA